MQFAFKSTRLFFGLLLILVFIVSCQSYQDTPSDTTSPADTTATPSPADTPAGTTVSPTDIPETLPTSSLPAKLDIDKIVQDAIDQLTVGKILFNIPEEMQVGKTERIEARIAKTITEDFNDKLQGNGKPIIQDIKFGAVTEVKLEGNGFDIKGISTGSLVTGGKEYTEWSWDVTPNKRGERTLSLIVSAKIKIPELEIDSVRNYTVEVKKIKVKVNPIVSAKGFLENNWKDLFPIVFGSGSIAGIIGWIIAKRKESKELNTNLPDNQEDVTKKEAADKE
jgi:hypothetical protein